MDFLKRIWEEIVATVKPTLVLFVSLIFWILNKITHLPRIIYWLILFPLSIGLCLYLSFFSITFIKGQRPWSSLSTPPDMPTEIVAANHTDILVKTSNGKYYKCTYEQDEYLYPRFPIELSTSCWQETTELSLERGWPYEVVDSSRDKLSWWVTKPGTPVDKLSIVTLAVDAGYTRSFIIDESGKVWIQQADGWSSPDPELVFPFIIGVTGSIFLSIVVLIFRYRFGKRIRS